MSEQGFRVERDSMGELRVPAEALWGAQTQRAIDNFPISGLVMPRPFIRALGLIKWAAAGANGELGLLTTAKARAIQRAALQVAEGSHDRHFPVDVFQTGSGIRQIATGVIDPKLWGTEEFKAHADLCFHCKMCQSECPSGIDVSSLMLEAKAAYVEHHGLAPGDWIFSRIELWARLASRLPILTNFLLSRGVSRADPRTDPGALPPPSLAEGQADAVHPPSGQARPAPPPVPSARALASSISSMFMPIITIRNLPNRSLKSCVWPV